MKRVIAEELMDAEDLDPATYAAVLADLSRVNAWTFAARPTLGFLDRLKLPDRTLTLLDVGSGEGGMLRRIARWARARGVTSRLVGVDLNPRSAPIARAATDPADPIVYRTGDYADIAADIGPIDAVVSSLVAHHMSDMQLDRFLRWMDATAARGWLVNDLHRHALADAAYPVLAALLRAHPIVRADGRLSIARSRTPAEWPALLARAGVRATVERWWPFRIGVAAWR